jgi:hypothetical protein
MHGVEWQEVTLSYLIQYPQQVGVLDASPFNGDITYDSVTIRVFPDSHTRYLKGECSGLPNPLFESGYELANSLEENDHDLE